MFESQVFIVKYSRSKQSASVILEHTLYPWGGNDSPQAIASNEC
jgi:hypothetical protein